MRLEKWWHDYWFRPGSLVNLAVVRILAVGFQLFYLILIDYRHSLVEAAARPDALYQPLPVLRLLLLPFAGMDRPSALFIEIVFWLTMAAGFLALIGWLTNLGLALFAAGNLLMVSFYYSFGDFHHPEALMLIALVILVFSPAGRALSLDAVLKRQKPGEEQEISRDILDRKSRLAAWPLLLVQWVYVLIYASAAISKLGKGGLDWMNGYTLQYFMFRDALRWGSDLGMIIGSSFALALVLSWFAILFESTFFLVLPFPKLALVYIPVGIAMHTAIYLTQRAPFPQYIVLYSVFVPWASVFKILRSGFNRSGLPGGQRGQGRGSRRFA